MTEAAENSDREPAHVEPATHSVRPVVEHALTVYYDGNAELARTLIDRLITEARAE